MKRFHVHIAVNDIADSVDFYTKLFGQLPMKQQPDYAKWMLDDPRVNFAISTQAKRKGIDHLGMEVESSEELENLRLLADDASRGDIRDQGQTTCCYANSEKHWTIDPQGIAWEHFMTYSDDDSLGGQSAARSVACCIPLHASTNNNSTQSSDCCVSSESGKNQNTCCWNDRTG